MVSAFRPQGGCVVSDLLFRPKAMLTGASPTHRTSPAIAGRTSLKNLSARRNASCGAEYRPVRRGLNAVELRVWAATGDELLV